jgi:hypothetical protein
MSATIPAAELALLRAAAEATFADVVEIRRASAASDEVGGETLTWSTVATAACQLLETTRLAREQEVGSTLQRIAGWQLNVPHGTDVRPKDRAKVNGIEYEVIAGFGARSNNLTTIVVLAEIS